MNRTKVIDARGGLILPGLINAHTHMSMSLFRGLADDLSLDDWLNKYIFPAEHRYVTRDFVTWSTRLSLLEMLRGGTTTVADMYYFEEEVAEATKAAGMRGVLGETLIGFPSPDSATSAAALTYTESFLKHWKGDPLITPAVAPHSIYTCSGDPAQGCCGARPARPGAASDPRSRGPVSRSRKAGTSMASPPSNISRASACWDRMSWARIAFG